MEMEKQEIIDLRFVFKRPFFTALSLDRQFIEIDGLQCTDRRLRRSATSVGRENTIDTPSDIAYISPV
jgi:hypothetical protein